MTVKLGEVNEELLALISEHIGFEVDQGVEEPKYDNNMSKVFHIFKRYFKENHPEDAKKFEENPDGDTLYKVMQRFSFATLLLYAGGYVTMEKLHELQAGGVKENKTYLYAVGDSKEENRNHFDTLNELLRMVWSARQERAWEDANKELSSFNLSPSFTSEELKSIDTIAEDKNMPKINRLLREVRLGNDRVSAANHMYKEAEARAKDKEKDIERLQSELSSYILAAETSTQPVEFESDGTIPEGSMTTRKASELFPSVKFKVDFDLPFFEWDGLHPDVPKVDDHYIFRARELTRVLYSIITNQRAYLHGHTGSGKTTLVEQAAARMGYPVARVNFDSNITRFDLIGRDTLSVDEGSTISTFVDGILPRAMSNPCIFIADEIDFCQPDVAYVMQAATEGNSLRIPEDGDRIVQPHPNFRMFATGNTVGQGDEHGMYQGARPQSLAFLDRFTVWCGVDYMDETQREELIKRHYPTFKTEDLNQFSKYIREHIEAFTGGKVLQPITPRGMLAIARATIILGDFSEALNMCVLDKASSDDRATLRGLIDRVTK